MQLPIVLAALGLCAVHMFAGKLRFLEGIPRSRWLSMAGGVSVAYVFIRLLPELSEAQKAFEKSSFISLLENHVYLIALAGLLLFYSLERMMKISKTGRDELNVTATGLFTLHMIAFGLYNALVGYLLVHREVPGILSLVWFFIAMALHFLVTDYGLREDHKERYRGTARWILSGAVLLGFLIGEVFRISDIALAILIAFLAGGVVLNVLKEELPAERKSRLLPFLTGAVAYAAILILSA